MHKVKAILFDMDGVLIDAKEWHYEALNKALLLFGMEINRHDHLVTYDGLPTKKKLEMLSKEKGLPVELHNFINEMKQQYTIEITFAKCKPMFLHEYALSKLKNEGYKIAVCSNSIRDTIVLMMEKSHLSKYIDLILSNQDIKNPKPDPEMYITAMKKLNMISEECLIVEDNDYGVKSALASGGHLLRVQRVFDVNYLNIKNRITDIEAI
jgi:HAD superfamily hydrolase (TIGR01509 family)